MGPVTPQSRDARTWPCEARELMMRKSRNAVGRTIEDTFMAPPAHGLNAFAARAAQTDSAGVAMTSLEKRSARRSGLIRGESLAVSCTWHLAGGDEHSSP